MTASSGRFEEIREHVRENGNVLTVSMEHLRDAYGAGRLGEHVRTGISRALDSVGLAHYPSPLPSYQDHAVRLYTRGTPEADIIHAVLNPGEAQDEALRQAAGKEAVQLLKQVRELLCQ